jgi:hypothetical protein
MRLEKRCKTENPRKSRVFFVFCRFSRFFEIRILVKIKVAKRHFGAREQK